DARIYGLFWHPTTPCNTGYYKAHQYASAVSQTNGTWGSICSSDYTPTLQAISQNIQTILKHQFALSHAPDAGTIHVKVNGQTMGSGWNIAGNVITFTEPPAEGATIAVSYTFGSSPIVKTFALSQPASPDG